MCIPIVRPTSSLYIPTFTLNYRTIARNIGGDLSFVMRLIAVIIIRAPLSLTLPSLLMVSVMFWIIRKIDGVLADHWYGPPAFTSLLRQRTSLLRTFLYSIIKNHLKIGHNSPSATINGRNQGDLDHIRWRGIQSLYKNSLRTSMIPKSTPPGPCLICQGPPHYKYKTVIRGIFKHYLSSLVIQIQKKHGIPPACP